MIYYPQFLNFMTAQGGYVPEADFKTSVQDGENGVRTAWSWYGAGIPGYPTGPLYKWRIPYEGLTNGEKATLTAFWQSVNGQYQLFTFLDPAGNLCEYSEDFTQSAWVSSFVTVTTNGGLADPFGGTSASLLTSSVVNGSLTTLVLPNGGASGFALCGSVWVRAAAATTLQLQFVDSTSAVLAAQLIKVPAASWIRAICPVTLATNNAVSFQIGGMNGALQLFGAQVAASPGAGGYAKTPGNYALHGSVRFDGESLKWTKTRWNSYAVTVSLRETNDSVSAPGVGGFDVSGFDTGGFDT